MPSNVMPGAPSLAGQIACPSCDRLYDVSGLKDGETARCGRCGHFLTRYRADELARVMAYATSAVVMLLLACSFPFLEFSFRKLFLICLLLIVYV